MVFVEYCSYKGLTLNHLRNKYFHCIVEYCSYKGLTHILACIKAPCILFVEYCSYKGLTHNYILVVHFLESYR